MEIKCAYKNYRLIESTHISFIMFMGGKDKDLPCLFSIGKFFVNEIKKNPELMEILIKNEFASTETNIENYPERYASAYLLNKLKAPDAIENTDDDYLEVNEIMKLLENNKDIYRGLLVDCVFECSFLKEKFKRRPIDVDGYTLEYFTKLEKLELWQAYVSLLHLLSDDKNKYLKIIAENKAKRESLLEAGNDITCDGLECKIAEKDDLVYVVPNKNEDVKELHKSQGFEYFGRPVAYNSNYLLNQSQHVFLEFYTMTEEEKTVAGEAQSVVDKYIKQVGKTRCPLIVKYNYSGYYMVEQWDDNEYAIVVNPSKDLNAFLADVRKYLMRAYYKTVRD